MICDVFPLCCTAERSRGSVDTTCSRAGSVGASSITHCGPPTTEEREADTANRTDRFSSPNPASIAGLRPSNWECTMKTCTHRVLSMPSGRYAKNGEERRHLRRCVASCEPVPWFSWFSLGLIKKKKSANKRIVASFHPLLRHTTCLLLSLSRFFCPSTDSAVLCRRSIDATQQVLLSDGEKEPTAVEKKRCACAVELQPAVLSLSWPSQPPPPLPTPIYQQKDRVGVSC